MAKHEHGKSPFTALFKRPMVVRLFHGVTPSSGSVLAEFVRQLVAANFCSKTAHAHARGALHVTVWAEQNGIRLRSLSAGAAQAFVKHAVRCRCHCVVAGTPSGLTKDRRRAALAALHVFRGFLQTGRIGPWEGDPPELSPLVRDFQTWLVGHRGVTPATARQYGRWAGVAIASLGEDPSEYTPLTIRRFVTACWRTQTPVSIEVIIRVLRHFIAFLSARSLCDVDLEGALPRLRISRPTPPPFVLTKKDFERTLKVVEGRLRDRAMLLLMFRLGLRGSDVVGLRLDDVNWQDGTILVSGKNRREEVLPLPQDVGDALLAYIRDERPRTGSEHVFLRERAPNAPIGRTGVIVMRRSAMERAGIRLPDTRAHITRHSVASDILRTSVPLSALQHLLRHRTISTTGTYCHVGQAVLRSVCQRWPT